MAKVVEGEKTGRGLVLRRKMKALRSKKALGTASMELRKQGGGGANRQP